MHVRYTSFQHMWEKLRALLIKRLQLRDMTAMYKSQVRPCHRLQIEDIYTYLEVLQCFAYIAWPMIDCHVKEEMIADQFLLGMGNHGISVQVAAHGHRCIKDILRVARSLEAVQEEEKFHS